MRANGTPLYFLPMFGFADPEAVMIEDAKYGPARRPAAWWSWSKQFNSIGT
jgi:hypothetical protein